MNLYDTAKLAITIPSGAKISDIVELEQGIYPAVLEVPILTLSTKLNFNVSIDDPVNLLPLYDGAGVKYAKTVAPTVAEAISLDSNVFRGFRYIQIEVADNQAANRVFQLGAKGH